MLKHYYKHQSTQRKEQRKELDLHLGTLVKQVDHSSKQLLKKYRPTSHYEERMIDPMRNSMHHVLVRGINENGGD